MSEHTAESGQSPQRTSKSDDLERGGPTNGSVAASAEKDAGDYTACGHRLIAPMVGQPGTARVAVYCDRLVNHDGNHHADVEWDEFGRAAQGDARRFLRGRADA